MTLRSGIKCRWGFPWTLGNRFSNLEVLPRNSVTIGLIIISLIFQRTATMPSKLTIRSVNDNNRFVFPGGENFWRTANEEERTIKREANSRGELEIGVANDFVFPTEETERQVNLFTPGPPPECRTKTYCENTASYPVTHVNNVIRQQDDLQYFAGVDVVDGIVQRIGDDSTPLCVAEERLIYPTAAQNKENNWLFVINQEGFKQGVRIETCRTSDSECTVIGNFITGYRSVCKQKYILRQLAAISQNGTAIRDSFRLPSSCCCHVKFDSAYNRIGISLQSNANNQTPISKKLRRKRTSIE